MAKAQVTEEALAQGIESLGGFGNLAAKPRRDSPFGSEFAAKRSDAKPAVEPQRPAQAAAVAPQAEVPSVVPIAPAPEVEVMTTPTETAEPRTTKIQTVKAAPPKREVARQEAEVESLEAPAKADDFTERITLQMTPEMRDKLNELARTLQRSRREKGGRITANTLMRVAIQSFIDSFDPKALCGVSSEDELLRQVQQKRRSRS